VSFASHDSVTGQVGTISLGLNGDGSAQYGIPITVFGQPSILVRETDVLRTFENVTGSNLNETVNGNGQDNVLDGRGGNDAINGNAGNDTLFGREGNDTLNGGSNNDTLIGGADNYILNGGADNDTYDFRGSGLGSVRTTVPRFGLRPADRSRPM
jgi:Ca2+-binding RTX toxin-like protein